MKQPQKEVDSSPLPPPSKDLGVEEGEGEDGSTTTADLSSITNTTAAAAAAATSVDAIASSMYSFSSDNGSISTSFDSSNSDGTTSDDSDSARNELQRLQENEVENNAAVSSLSTVMEAQAESLSSTNFGMDQALRTLSAALQQRFPCSAAYTLALQQQQQQQSNHHASSYVQSRKFRLQFLQATQWNAMAAAAQIERYLEEKLHLFGPHALTRNITWQDLTEDDKKLLRQGCFQLLSAGSGGRNHNKDDNDSDSVRGPSKPPVLFCHKSVSHCDEKKQQESMVSFVKRQKV